MRHGAVGTNERKDREEKIPTAHGPSQIPSLVTFHDLGAAVYTDAIQERAEETEPW